MKILSEIATVLLIIIIFLEIFLAPRFDFYKKNVYLWYGKGKKRSYKKLKF